MRAEAGNAAEIASRNPLARFIYSSSHFSRENNRVKHNAFMPAADGKTSVYRTKKLSETETWTIGEEVADQRKQTLHARGDIVAADVSKVKLRVVPSEPPPHHANIEDWPAEKSAQKLNAIDLAEAARLVIKP
jgi:hypothetical protein